MLTLPYVHYTILNKSSMMLCILNLCIACVLIQEQRKLNGTGAATGVRTLMTRIQNLWSTYPTFDKGCLPGYP